MFNLNLFNKISTNVLILKNDLQLDTELELISKYNTSISDDYRQAIVLILKERGYSRLEIGLLLKDKI
ncbi:hypothetical protein ABW55_10550 [Acinetobacter sp. C15]|uniref:hypothetical protein n=1 Tax=unclassified Acinetobacter TaxID=196816 RepID=UPI0006617EE5|nr:MULTISPECIES: hypothetical protein [unclassified Acinetobacter]KOR15073.1 hypothetical protein ABW55_10550 [Acinetobacter sp. C15]